ncbi:MAG: hypothetical protein QXD13_00735 [Candidatus Pacearchaeota archaeon]
MLCEKKGFRCCCLQELRKIIDDDNLKMALVKEISYKKRLYEGII